jgi:hypothetical protein
MPSEAFDVGTTRTEQRDPMFCAPLHILTEIKLIRLARQSAVTRQEPAQRNLLLAREDLVALYDCCRRNHLHGTTSGYG